MPSNNKKLIIDNNSLVNFFNYYYFDRDNGNIIYKDIVDFLFTKIESGELIIIDKVFGEFQYTDYYSRPETIELKKRISKFVINTEHLLLVVEQLLLKYYFAYNRRVRYIKSTFLR